MRLTIEEHAEAIKRYRHLEPARGWHAEVCAARSPGNARTCSRSRGHRGPHAAHGRFRKVVAVWDGGGAPGAGGDAAGPAPKSVRRRGTGGRRPIGLRTGRPGTRLGALWRRLADTFSSVEEVALLVLFVAFVWFAVDWLLLMLG